MIGSTTWSLSRSTARTVLVSELADALDLLCGPQRAQAKKTGKQCKERPHVKRWECQRMPGKPRNPRGNRGHQELGCETRAAGPSHKWSPTGAEKILRLRFDLIDRDLCQITLQLVVHLLELSSLLGLEHLQLRLGTLRRIRNDLVEDGGDRTHKDIENVHDHSPLRSIRICRWARDGVCLAHRQLRLGTLRRIRN